MLINGIPGDTIKADNRGLAYGDGVFETIRIQSGKLLFLQQHLDRLQRGLERLGITDCLSAVKNDLDSITDKLPAEGVLKVIVTRGAGGRGYRSDNAAEPDRIVSLSKLPPEIEAPGIQAFVCRTRLAENRLLAGIKHLNRLEQVIASAQWPGEAFHEGLMLNESDLVIEGTRSNIFVATDNRLLTPALDSCGIEGVLRQTLLDTIPEAEVADIPLSQLSKADEIFFCNSVAGIWPVLSLHLPDGRVFSRMPGRFSQSAQQVFAQALAAL